MNITNELLQKLQKLSSLPIENGDNSKTAENLNQILSFVEVLNELNLDDEEATFTTQNQILELREDIAQNDPQIIKIILDNAPKSEDGFFVVPKIIE